MGWELKKINTIPVMDLVKKYFPEDFWYLENQEVSKERTIVDDILDHTYMKLTELIVESRTELLKNCDEAFENWKSYFEKRLTAVIPFSYAAHNIEGTYESDLNKCLESYLNDKYDKEKRRIFVTIDDYVLKIQIDSDLY